MSRIVDDLIVLAKAEQPDFLALGPVDVADLTVEVAAKARALGRRQWTVAEVAETVILADGQRLTQALLQLAANAVQHTGDGDRIAIGSTTSGGRVRLWVATPGPASPPRTTSASSSGSPAGPSRGVRRRRARTDHRPDHRPGARRGRARRQRPRPGGDLHPRTACPRAGLPAASQQRAGRTAG